MIYWINKMNKRHSRDYDVNVTQNGDKLRISFSPDSWKYELKEARMVKLGLDPDTLRLYIVPDKRDGYVLNAIDLTRPWLKAHMNHFAGLGKCFLGAQDIKSDEIGLYIEGVR